jgi:hypothetical protein
MPITLDIIRASEFIRLDATEHLDFGASKHVLEGLAFACRKRGIERAMLDLRTVPVPAKPLFTAAELSALIGAFRDAGFSRRHRLAILYREDAHGGIRTFAFLSKLRGLQVRAFNDFEKALQWLSEEPEDLVEHRMAAPVSIAKREPKKRVEDSSMGRARSVTVRALHSTTRAR